MYNAAVKIGKQDEAVYTQNRTFSPTFRAQYRKTKLSKKILK